jgi:hypothetical protein
MRISAVKSNRLLEGRMDNNASLVKVDGGSLVMNEGAKVTGNTYRATVTGTRGGGIYAVNSTMHRKQ